MTKAISLTHIELRAIGLEPEFELQTIGNDVKIEVNAIAGQDDQPQRSAVPENESELLNIEEVKRTSDTRYHENSPNESESELPKKEEAERTSDTKHDKTEIIPLLQTDQFAEPGDTKLIQ